MRTQEILDSIDHALEDWSVSCDAMRWSPDPPQPEPATPTLNLRGPSSLTLFVRADSTRFYEALTAAASAAVDFAAALAATGVVFGQTGTAWSTLLGAHAGRQERRRVRTVYRRRTLARRRRQRRA